MSYLLIGLLVVAALIVGYLFNKVQTLEKSKVAGVAEVKTENQVATLAPPAAEKAEIVVAEDDPSLGPKDAKVKVVVFSDFLCPFCAAISGESKTMLDNMKSRDPSWQAAIPAIKEEYVKNGKVQLVWKDTPFHGAEAIQVHAAARCAADQEKFWEFHDYFFSKFGESQESSTKDGLKKLASVLKLDEKEYTSCIDSDKYLTKVQEGLSYAQRVGVQGTPATYINGKLLSGAASYPQFKSMIEEELKK